MLATAAVAAAAIECYVDKSVFRRPLTQRQYKLTVSVHSDYGHSAIESQRVTSKLLISATGLRRDTYTHALTESLQCWPAYVQSGPKSRRCENVPEKR